jgi:hypothetical protein
MPDNILGQGTVVLSLSTDQIPQQLGDVSEAIAIWSTEVGTEFTAISSKFCAAFQGNSQTMWDDFSQEAVAAASGLRYNLTYMGELGRGFGSDFNATMKSVFEDLFAGHMNTAAAYAGKLKDAMLKSFADMIAGWVSAQVTQSILNAITSMWQSVTGAPAAYAAGLANGQAYAAGQAAGMAGGAGAADGAGLASTLTTTGLVSGALLGAGALYGATQLASAANSAAGGGAAGGLASWIANPIGAQLNALSSLFGGGSGSLSTNAHGAAVGQAQKIVADGIAAKADPGQIQAALINAGLAWNKQDPHWGNVDEVFGNAAENGLAAAFPGMAFGISNWTKQGNALSMTPPGILTANQWQAMMGSPLSSPIAAGLPHLATGGIVNQPTIALIGEAGPEAVVPLSGPGAPGGGGQPMIVKLIVNTRELASVLLDMSRTGQLKIDTNALITVGRV